jgi:hypothetical protein
MKGGCGAGFCTFIYLFVTWFRRVFEAAGKDPLAELIPVLVSRLQVMTRNVAPLEIPRSPGQVPYVVIAGRQWWSGAPVLTNERRSGHTYSHE